MPVPSAIQIFYDGNDITDKVMFNTARFEAQASGGVGTFSFVVKDRGRTQSFTTGKEVLLVLDGTPYFGGYLMQNGQQFAFPVVNTTNIGAVTARQFALTGTNYNVLLDRLVTRNTSDYLHALPIWPSDTLAGTLVRNFCANYIDVPAGFNTTTFVDDIGVAGGLHNLTAGGQFAWQTQGASWRSQMKWVSEYVGAIYYLDASKNLQYHAPEKVFSRWGFSDRPNHKTVLSSQTKFSGATYGFREMQTTQDLTNIINDVFIWGGSPFSASATPGPSGTVFARRTNTTSVAQYGRWQGGPPPRFGDAHAASQAQVDDLAEAIVFNEGTTGLSADGVIRNASFPDWTVGLTWFAHDVPTLETSVKDHLKPGDIVTIILYVHGTDLTHPLVLTLPLRRVSISFPTLPASGGGQPKTYARFDGQFGLSLSDPFNLWEAILTRRTSILNTIFAAGSPTTTGSLGGIWQGAPDETPNGTRQTFTLSSAGTPIVYVAGTSYVYVNGLLLRQGADYSEDPSAGTLFFFVPPSTGSVISVIVRLAG